LNKFFYYKNCTAARAKHSELNYTVALDMQDMQEIHADFRDLLNSCRADGKYGTWSFPAKKFSVWFVRGPIEKELEKTNAELGKIRQDNLKNRKVKQIGKRRRVV